jgi:hypothetical protein
MGLSKRSLAIVIVYVFTSTSAAVLCLQLTTPRTRSPLLFLSHAYNSLNMVQAAGVIFALDCVSRIFQHLDEKTYDAALVAIIGKMNWFTRITSFFRPAEGVH